LRQQRKSEGNFDFSKKPRKKKSGLIFNFSFDFFPNPGENGVVLVLYTAG
jgi:hypothetical protein